MSGFPTARLILLYIIISCKSILSDKLDQPMYAIKQIQTVDDTLMKPVRPEEHYEYPVNNEMAFSRISNNWKSYYSCLETEFYYEKERKPIIVQIMESQSTILKCSHCPRPFKENDNLQWRYKPLSTDADDPEEPEILDLAPQMKFSHKMSLKIYNAVAGYSGLYVCLHGSSPTSVYILEVIPDQSMSLLPQPPADEVFGTGDTQLVVYYLWSKWTECSACDLVGKRFVYGTCMVRVQDISYYSVPEGTPSNRQSLRKLKRHAKQIKKNEDYKLPESEPPLTLPPLTEPSLTLTTLSDLSLTEPLLTEAPSTEPPRADSDSQEFGYAQANELLRKFGTGIPCTSPLLPSIYRPFLDDLNKTAMAVLFEFCKEECPQSTIFELIDKQGKIVEVANNTSGIYSSHQLIPKIAPEVERKTVTVQFGKNITIQCPGNLCTDTPVTWMIEKQILVPELVDEESNGRVTIDLLNRLHIKRARLKDGRIYSCWQRNKLAGTVTLNVEKSLQFTYNHHMVLVSMLAIALTFIYVGIKVLKRELMLRKRLTA